MSEIVMARLAAKGKIIFLYVEGQGWMQVADSSEDTWVMKDAEDSVPSKDIDQATEIPIFGIITFEPKAE